MKQETKGIFDEKISDVEAHRQLLILNEANMYDLFRRKNMAIMKKLTEGDGCPLENKQCHPFTGFIGSHQLITCNYLCCPFVPPGPNTTNWDQYEYTYENPAIMSRCTLVKFTKLHAELNLSFEDKQWAQCMLYMAENFENVKPPDEPKLFEVEKSKNGSQILSQFQQHVPE